MSRFSSNHPSPSEIYTLSLHDALPILTEVRVQRLTAGDHEEHGPQHDEAAPHVRREEAHRVGRPDRSEEHTSEFQSLRHLVCRLLLEKKKKEKTTYRNTF